MRSPLASLHRLHSSVALCSVTVCSGESSFTRRCLSAYERRGPKESRADKKPRQRNGRVGFPNRPVFSERVAECIPLAIERVGQRPVVDEWTPIEPRSPKNRIVTLEGGDRRIVGKKGALLPFYRDWEKEFGKLIGDSRPYYRKHMGPLLMPYNEQPGLDTIDSLVVVEGLKDWHAIKSAVNAQVFVCDGASILNHVHENYVKRTISSYNGDLILLMDPDTAGRRMRTAVNTLMAPCRHAFISEYEAVVGMGTNYESIGIENATPECIRHALENTRTFSNETERHIHFDDLYELGLVQTPAEHTEGVRLRRRFACGFLGIGFCDGRQLLKQLNGYDFSMEEVQAATSKANVLLEEWKRQPWRLQKDYTKRLPSTSKLTTSYTITKDFISAF